MEKFRAWYMAGVLLLILLSAAMLVLVIDRIAPIGGSPAQAEVGQAGEG